MLPLEILEYVSLYLKNATEVGRLCSAFNIPVFLNPSTLPLHIRNDMIACTLSHNRKDIFVKILNHHNETFMNELWDFFCLCSRLTNISTISRSRSNGGHLWGEYTMRFAAQHHKNEIVIWLYDQQCPFDKEVMSVVAAKYDNFDILMWLREIGCPIKSYLYRVNRIHAKTHKIADWMGKQEKMGEYLFEHIDSIMSGSGKHMDFAI